MLDNVLASKACLFSWKDIPCIELLREESSHGHYHRRDKSKRGGTMVVYKPESADASRGRRSTNTLSAYRGAF